CLRPTRPRGAEDADGGRFDDRRAERTRNLLYNSSRRLFTSIADRTPRLRARDLEPLRLEVALEGFGLAHRREGFLAGPRGSIRTILGPSQENHESGAP